MGTDVVDNPITFQVRHHLHGGSVTVGLVNLIETDLSLVSERGTRTRFTRWGWGILRGRPPGPVKHLCYPVHTIQNRELNKKDGKSHTGEQQKDTAESLAHALAEIWLWRSAPQDDTAQKTTLPASEPLKKAQQFAPLLCWNGDKRRREEIAEAVDEWKHIIMPCAAEIIHVFYGQGHQLEQVDPKWAKAALTLIRGWLAFYAREDAPKDRRHTHNRLMLWRMYALLLLGIHLKQEQWADDQQEELERALQQWLTICMDDETAWIFQHQDAAWWGPSLPAPSSRAGHGSALAYRERIREAEVRRITDSLAGLLREYRPADRPDGNSKGVSPHAQKLRGYLELAVVRWYLPRYDIDSARKIHRQLTSPTTGWYGNVQWIGLSVWNWATFGMSRLYAAIGAGYATTALQGDTWKLLYGIIQHHQLLWVLFLFFLSGVLLFFYLRQGIQRKVGIESTRRTVALLLRGEVCAILLGTGLATVFAPLIEIEEATFLETLVHAQHISWIGNWGLYPQAALLILLYAQIALFLGIFIQLLFDEKPTTALLDSP